MRSGLLGGTGCESRNGFGFFAGVTCVNVYICICCHVEGGPLRVVQPEAIQYWPQLPIKWPSLKFPCLLAVSDSLFSADNNYKQERQIEVKVWPKRLQFV